MEAFNPENNQTTPSLKRAMAALDRQAENLEKLERARSLTGRLKLKAKQFLRAGAFAGLALVAAGCDQSPVIGNSKTKSVFSNDFEGASDKPKKTEPNPEVKINPDVAQYL